MNSARSRSYVGRYGPVGPGPIGPGLGWFPGIRLLFVGYQLWERLAKGRQALLNALRSAAVLSGGWVIGGTGYVSVCMLFFPLGVYMLFL
jgi:hypothetical protein